jgi:hypothetical protein
MRIGLILKNGYYGVVQRYSAALQEQNVEAAQENLEKMQTVF